MYSLDEYNCVHTELIDNYVRGLLFGETIAYYNGIAYKVIDEDNVVLCDFGDADGVERKLIVPVGFDSLDMLALLHYDNKTLSLVDLGSVTVLDMGIFMTIKIKKLIGNSVKMITCSGTGLHIKEAEFRNLEELEIYKNRGTGEYTTFARELTIRDKNIKGLGACISFIDRHAVLKTTYKVLCKFW